MVPGHQPTIVQKYSRLVKRTNSERNSSIPDCIGHIPTLRPRAHCRISQLQTTHGRRIGRPEGDERCCIQSWRGRPFLWGVLQRLRAVVYDFHVVLSDTLLATRSTSDCPSASDRGCGMVVVRRSSGWCCDLSQVFWFAASNLLRRVDSSTGLGCVLAHLCGIMASKHGLRSAENGGAGEAAGRPWPWLAQSGAKSSQPTVAVRITSMIS